MDICWYYNNIHIKKGDEYKAAFKTHLGLFEPTVMTFGLCNPPATFQTFMNNIFEDMVDEGHVVVYLDDILIFSDDPAQLECLTHEVLSHLEKYDLYLKLEKCVFAQTSIEYLRIVMMVMFPWTQPRWLESLIGPPHKLSTGSSLPWFL